MHVSTGQNVNIQQLQNKIKIRKNVTISHVVLCDSHGLNNYKDTKP
jgi:hypothetical protein